MVERGWGGMAGTVHLLGKGWHDNRSSHGFEAVLGSQRAGRALRFSPDSPPWEAPQPTPLGRGPALWGPSHLIQGCVLPGCLRLL